MDKIQENFIKKIQEEADNSCKGLALILQENFSLTKADILNSFHVSMLKALEKFSIANNEHKVDNLTWVYLSYLRSGILVHTPCIRIDCYDQKDRISEIECCEKWEFSYMWKPFWQLCATLKENFQQQTRAKGYELDYMVLEMAERFHLLHKVFIPVILKAWLQNYGTEVLGEKRVYFKLGDYFDHAELIATWDGKMDVLDNL